MEVDGDAVALADAVDDTDTTVREAEGVAVTRGERDDEVDADWEAVADEERVDVLDAGNFLTVGKYDTGLPATWLEGDFNYDGVVDVLDASEFFSTGLYDAGNYNQPAGSQGAVAAVPEPASWAMLAAAAGAVAGCAVRRRR